MVCPALAVPAVPTFCTPDEGETGRSARTRGAEHLKELEKKKEKSVLFKHKISDHKNENVKFRMEITKKFHDALTRQANEAV